MFNKKFLKKLLIWRVRHIGEKKFVYVLAVIIGLICGLAAVLLKTSVHQIEMLVRNSGNINDLNYYYLILPGFGILLTVLFIRFFVKDDISHGVTKILYSISKSNSKIKSHNTYSSIVASSLTSGFGGSVGMEAPILYTGAAIGSNVGQLFGLHYKTLTLLIGCGVAGSLAAIFKAPIAGLIFAFEVLMLDLTTASIVPILMSTVTGAIISSLLIGERIEFYFTLKEIFKFENIPFYLLLGIATGLISLYFIRMNSFLENKFSAIKKSSFRIILGWILAGIIIFLFPALYGEGYIEMKAILSGKVFELSNNSIFHPSPDQLWMFILFLIIILFLKVVAMAITTGSGGIGGIFAPSLFVGSVAGFTFAKVINQIFPNWVSLPESNFTLVGMAGLIAGVMQAPLTAIFLIAEITGGYGLFIPLIVTASISYITIHYFEKHSIYAKPLARKGLLITHNKDKAVLSMMKIEDVIEKNFSHINPDDTLGNFIKVIAESKRNIFPVTDDENNFYGIVQLDDVREIMFDEKKYNILFVKDLMIQPLEKIDTNDSMETVMKKFKESNAWNLPVIKNNKYIGFISRSNLFNAYRKKLIDFAVE